jgi:hypothetical protein
MKKIMYLVLFCLSLTKIGFTAEEALTEWDLRNACPYTCRQAGGDLTYLELLNVAQGQGGSPEDWAIVNKVTVLFSKPIEKPRNLNDDVFNTALRQRLGLDFSDSEFRDFRAARSNLIAWFLEKQTRGLPGFKRTDINRGSTGIYSEFLHDFRHALDILHKNSWDYVGSLT